MDGERRAAGPTGSTASGNEAAPWSDEAFVGATSEGRLAVLMVLRCICGRVVAGSEEVSELPREAICGCGDHVRFHPKSVEVWFSPVESQLTLDAVDPVNRGSSE